MRVARLGRLRVAAAMAALVLVAAFAAPASALTPGVLLTLSVSPNPAAPDATVTWTGTVAPAVAPMANVRVHMEFVGTGPMPAGTCEPAEYCSVTPLNGNAYWEFPTLASKVTIRYHTPAAIGKTGRLFLDSDGLCYAPCPATATLKGPTLSASLSYTSSGPVVAGNVLHIVATGMTDVGPVEDALLHVNLPAGVGPPTNLSSPDAVYAPHPAHYIDYSVTYNKTQSLSFDVVVNAANGTTLTFVAQAVPVQSWPIGQASVTVKVGPDATAPTATAPKHTFVTGTALSGGRLPVRLAWTGDDNFSGVARYDLAQSTDGGAWATVSSVTSSATYRHLSYGHTYRFRIRPIDVAGNTGAWVYGSTFRLSGYSEATGAARYTGTWSSVSSTAYWGGKAKAASTAGRKVTFTFTGRSVAWVSLRSPARGRAAIYVNGVYQGTVDLYAATTQPQRLGWAKTWTTSATRTLEIRVLGTAGRPRIDVDGFWVGS